jgi:DnaJ family protein A protein 2
MIRKSEKADLVANTISPDEVWIDEYYNLLGVDKNADKSSIKKAYHKLALNHHPDKGGDPDKFKLIAEAFEVLSDPEKKKLYDSGGKEAINGQGMSNPMDMFSQMFSGNRNTKRKGKH